MRVAHRSKRFGRGRDGLHDGHLRGCAARRAARRGVNIAVAVDTADVAYDGACEGPVELESGDGVAPSPAAGADPLRSPGVLAAEAAEAAASGEEGGGSAYASAARYGGLDISAPLKAHDVWCAITRQLKRLCIDPRPEVRTCTLHTLASIVTSHGHAIGGRSWDHLIHRTVLPLLRETMSRASSASHEVLDRKLGTTETGRDVLMQLHHTRDTDANEVCGIGNHRVRAKACPKACCPRDKMVSRRKGISNLGRFDFS